MFYLLWLVRFCGRGFFKEILHFIFTVYISLSFQTVKAFKNENCYPPSILAMKYPTVTFHFEIN